MNIDQQSIIDFLKARASDTELDAVELDVFTSELKTQIDQLSVDVPNADQNAITLLYSGDLRNGQPSAFVANEIARTSSLNSVRILDQTAVGQLLNDDNREFHDALRNALGGSDGGIWGQSKNSEILVGL